MLFKSNRKRESRERADSLYKRIVEASRQPAFFIDFAVPDTLDGRFEMLSLHMFLGLRQLVDADRADKELAQNIMELFVRDMDAALRELGVSDIKVPKRMKALYGSFGGRIAGYTLAVEEGGEALHAALARNIYPDGGESGNVMALAAYMQAVMQGPAAATIDDLRAGIVNFPDPAPFKSQGTISEGRSDG